LGSSTVSTLSRTTRPAYTSRLAISMSSSPARSGALVIVTGLPASGKSTLVAALAARLCLRVLSKDVFKEALFERLGTGNAAWSARLSAAAFEALFADAARALDDGAALALDGNFRPGVHEAPLRAALAARGAAAGGAARVAQVLCRAPEAQRVARLAARAAGATRHPGHLDAVALDALRAGRAAGPGAPGDRFLDLPGPQLVYDSGSPSALADVLDRLDAWLAAGAAPDRAPHSSGEQT
jgi:predicted kinase